MFKRSKYPVFFQLNMMDCGATCLKMVAKFHGLHIKLETLRTYTETNREGTTLKGLSKAAEQIGFRTLALKCDLEELKKDIPLPVIIHWNKNHFVVVYQIKKKTVIIADPSRGLSSISKNEFIEGWIGETASKKGVILAMEPHDLRVSDSINSKGFTVNHLLVYVKKYKSFFLQLAFGLGLGSLIQLFFPFLTQSLVDIGIQGQNIDFVYLILIAQVTLFLGRTSIDLIRGWILLHLGARLRISLVSDFFFKLMSLPISYFDTKKTGDTLQRLGDHNRIQTMLTQTLITVLFSTMNFIVFGIVLFYYNYQIALTFLVGSVCYLIWIVLFLKRRKKLDHERFKIRGSEQSKIIELVNGMQEIKLLNAETEKRWKWEDIQAELYYLEVKNLILEQSQNTGSQFINELKNILITVLSAKLVIESEITLGMMLSISYIIGQLNGPVLQMIGFTLSFQDSKIALERLSEIYSLEDEDKGTIEPSSNADTPFIEFRDVCFNYPGQGRLVLDNLNLVIEENQNVAIVGVSGSGKTTILKLLLKFYKPQSGEILINGVNLDHVSTSYWRSICGAVMQEGYLFNETISENITIKEDNFSQLRLHEAAQIACIHDFVEQLPISYQTKIGSEGLGLSTGQKQRILIARAIYKNAKVLLFDEATSSLDANSEKEIVKNVEKFMKNRTALTIAHRLSTVKNADKIIVLDKGKILEQGNHQHLLEKKSLYYELVKNQLDLNLLNNE